MTQGERVNMIRKSLNLTLEKFGLKVGVGKTAISKIEKGDVNLTDQMAKSICREFNVNYEFLINGTGEMFSDLPQTTLDELCQQYKCDRLDRLLIESYLKLDTEKRQAVKQYMKNLADSMNHDVPEAETDIREHQTSTIAEAEDAYIKSLSRSVQSTDLNASNSTGAEKDDAAVG